MTVAPPRPRALKSAKECGSDPKCGSDLLSHIAVSCQACRLLPICRNIRLASITRARLHAAAEDDAAWRRARVAERESWRS